MSGVGAGEDGRTEKREGGGRILHFVGLSEGIQNKFDKVAVAD